MHRSGVAAALAALLVLAGAGLGCGNGSKSVLGVGNGGNRFMLDEIADELAEALAEHPATPKVSNALVLEIYEQVVEQARDGDLRASLVILELAAYQREPEE